MPERCAKRAGSLICALVAERLAAQGSCVVAVAGGATMLPVFRTLAAATHERSLDWGGVTFLWVDERRVPQSSPESNYGNALRAGLDTLTRATLLPMPTGGDAEADAHAYEQAVRGVLRSPAGRLRPIDVVALGVGADGHVASLFPGAPALAERRRMVVAASSPGDGSERLTMTLRPLRAARVRIIVATGTSKRWIVARARRGGGEARLPIDEVVAARGRTEWCLDDAAAAGLPS